MNTCNEFEEGRRAIKRDFSLNHMPGGGGTYVCQRHEMVKPHLLSYIVVATGGRS